MLTRRVAVLKFEQESRDERDEVAMRTRRETGTWIRLR
jgi:hypothetical protein